MPNNIWWKYPISIFSNICGKVYGIHGNVCIWTYVILAVLWITVANHRNSPTNFSGNLSLPILRNSFSTLGADTTSQEDRQNDRSDFRIRNSFLFCEKKTLQPQNYWVFGFPLLTRRRTQIHFPKRRVFYFLEHRTMEKVQKKKQ
jgi:hypothetical protein